MSVSPKVFESQMQWLVDQGYTTIDLDTAIDVLAGKRSDIAKPVVITFDDNQLSAYDLAVPILKRNRQIAVFYLIANRLKHHGMIDESRVKNLVEAGMDIQSHSVTHSIMTKLTIKKLDQELGQSKEIIEAVTGKKVRHLAYPLTAQNKMVRERVKAAGYASATIMDPRVATSKDDLLKLPRIMMTDETEMSRILK